MNKDIRDYLPFYLGCEIFTGTGYVRLVAIQVEVIPCTSYRIIVLNGNIVHEITWSDKGRLCVRPLSDMTEEEKKEFEATKVFIKATPVHIIGNMQWTAETFRWALSKSFDLFGLIESNLAIDKTKLQTT